MAPLTAAAFYLVSHQKISRNLLSNIKQLEDCQTFKSTIQRGKLLRVGRL